MIDADGKCKVFLACEMSGDDFCVLGVHDTSDGAARDLEEHGFRFTTAAPAGSGWSGIGWYRHDEWQFHDEWLRGRIDEFEVEQ